MRALITLFPSPAVADSAHLAHCARAGSTPVRVRGPMSRHSVPEYEGTDVDISLTTREHWASLKAPQLKVTLPFISSLPTFVCAPNEKGAEPTTGKHFERANAEGFPVVERAEISSDPESDLCMASSSEINVIVEPGTAVHPSMPLSKAPLSSRFTGSAEVATCAGAESAKFSDFSTPSTMPRVARELFNLSWTNNATSTASDTTAMLIKIFCILRSP